MAAKDYLLAHVSITDIRKLFMKHAGDPTSNQAPDFEGQFCYDSTNNKMYVAVGTTDTDWELITSS